MNPFRDLLYFNIGIWCSRESLEKIQFFIKFNYLHQKWSWYLIFLRMFSFWKYMIVRTSFHWCFWLNYFSKNLLCSIFDCFLHKKPGLARIPGLTWIIQEPKLCFKFNEFLCYVTLPSHYLGQNSIKSGFFWMWWL